ncbi:hypothetical protein [Aquimarina aggregata]|uniref:hypothetical protein n=1 Tax=Aquimarina aggregata TaxID=1642818 RepID=UPI00248FCBF1|nr:hypothetical protein [Aquimarina aggregata]
MKTIKTLFAILVLSTFFIACEADATNDEIGIENIDVISEEDEDQVDPEPTIKSIEKDNTSKFREEDEDQVKPESTSN